MYKFKNTLFTHIGLLALIGLITILTPFKGYSQQQQGATTAPTEVRVVNPANTPVATKIVNASNDPVPVSGTIKVSNTGNTALNVRSNETRAQAVYKFGEFVLVAALAQESPTIYTVPANKRLVIEHVSAKATLSSGEELLDFQIYIRNQDGSTVGSHFLPMLAAGSTDASGYARFNMSMPMRLYLDAGMKVSFTVARNAASSNSLALLRFSGYLISSN